MAVLLIFLKFCKSDISRYGYLEVFQSPFEFEITRVDCVTSFRADAKENARVAVSTRTNGRTDGNLHAQVAHAKAGAIK